MAVAAPRRGDEVDHVQVDDSEIVTFETAADMRAWLEENDDTSNGIWLRIANKGSAMRTVSYAEAVQAALEHGWIDGQARSFDDGSHLQRYTPRRSRSPWSMRNRRFAEQLIADGRMSPRGLAEVERARADGRWDRAYEGSKDAQPHPDFLDALARSPRAAAFYETLNAQNRYAIYFRIQSLATQEARARKIAAFVSALERGEAPYA
jgi:uncharacterized protein YdeI (YjbR/CyaY-like superfamily)